MPLRSFLVIATVLGISTAAHAQPASASYGPPAAGPHGPAPAADDAPPAPRKWSFGFRVGMGDMGDELGNQAELMAYGVFARYRVNRSWAAELDVGKTRAALTGNRSRELRPITLSVLYHFFEAYRFDTYLRAGVARADEIYRNPNATVEFKDTELHIGAGIDYALRPDIALSAQLRLFSLTRESKGVAATLGASGHVLGLAAAYRF